MKATLRKATFSEKTGNTHYTFSVDVTTEKNTVFGIATEVSSKLAQSVLAGDLIDLVDYDKDYSDFITLTDRSTISSQGTEFFEAQFVDLPKAL